MAERRKETKSRMSISQILDFMQKTADDNFNGDLQNNMLAIFNQLQLGDKKTFLRKSLMLHWEHQIELAKGGLQDVVIDEKLTIDRTSVDMERKTISEVNYAEQAKMKSWFIKTMFIIGVLLFIAIVVFTYYTGSVNEHSKDILEYLKDLFELFIDLKM